MLITEFFYVKGSTESLQQVLLTESRMFTLKEFAFKYIEGIPYGDFRVVDRLGIEQYRDTKESFEAVEHPSHYGGEESTYEAIKVIEAWDLGFCLGNTIKYISRAGKKDANKEIEDLEKALWYLQREIANRKTSSTNP